MTATRVLMNTCLESAMSLRAVVPGTTRLALMIATASAALEPSIASAWTAAVIQGIQMQVVIIDDIGPVVQMPGGPERVGVD